MTDRRIKNQEIFQDTMSVMKSKKQLIEAVKLSTELQKVYLEDEELVIAESAMASGQKDDGSDEKFNSSEMFNDSDMATVSKKDSLGKKDGIDKKVIISKKRSFEAAEGYKDLGKKVCVLNFASSTNPGGGVANGASAQEECLCRCSTLYPNLNTATCWEQFYARHREMNNALYNDDIIYTPGVVVFKTDDDFPTLRPEEKWYQVDVITCAAPNLRRVPSNAYNPHGGKAVTGLTEQQYREIMEKRIRRIFQVAILNEVKVLILGAFGCGAFRNPPKVVAEIFKKVMLEYRDYFDTIEYAVYCKEFETENYDAFCKVLG